MSSHQKISRGVGPGRKSDKPWQMALRRVALMKEPKSGERYIDLLAKRCMTDAIKGDNAAMLEIGNRMDGRHIVIEGSNDNPVQMFTRIERVIVDAVSEDGEVVLPSGPVITSH